MLKLKDCFYKEKKCEGLHVKHDGWVRAHIKLTFKPIKDTGKVIKYYCLPCFLEYVEQLDSDYEDTIKRLWEFEEQREMSLYR
jgi:hypothetical protein